MQTCFSYLCTCFNTHAHSLWIILDTHCSTVSVDIKVSRATQRACGWLVVAKLKQTHFHLLHPATSVPSLTHSSASAGPLPPPLPSDLAHLPRVCPFQQRSSLVTSAAIFSSLQMVCGRDTQKPRIGRSRSFSSVTCMAGAERKLVMSQTWF